MTIRLYLHEFVPTEPSKRTETLRLFWAILPTDTSDIAKAAATFACCRYGRKQVRLGNATSFHVVTGG